MKHVLVPPFILDRYAAGELAGEFEAAALFVDVSGFTPLTAALMAHGKAGAEVIADALLAVFEPLTEMVTGQDGFVAAFAGDAFLALFPDAQAGVGQALAAGKSIQVYMRTHAEISTPYGAYPFSVRLGLAYGRVAWGILGDEVGQQHTYYFRGEAVERSAQAQRQAGRGEMRLSSEVEALLAMETPGALTIPRAAAALRPGDALLGERFFIPELLSSPVRGEFREVVSVFVNLPGEAMHADLADFVKLLYRLLDQYGGYLCRLGVGFAERGCSLLLFWGAPACYENDLARALAFLLDLRAASPLTFRAGVTQQAAYAGYVGSPLREEYTCHGSRVNLANRLMTSAGWGEIWVDEIVARRGEGRFEIAMLGARVFKGFEQPLGCYVLRGRALGGLRLYGREMVGRQGELERLRDFVAPIFEGDFAGTAVVYGEPGIGKSRLLDAVRQMSGGALWLTGQPDEILRGSLSPFRYLLPGYFGQEPLWGEAENKAQFDRKLNALMAAMQERGEGELAAELERVRSFLGALVGLRWDGSLYEQLEPKLRFENTLYALKALIQAECRRQPVVLALEDAHWLDGDSQKLLGMLTRSMAGYPLAIVCASRYQDDGGKPALEAGPGAPQETIELDNLPPEAVTILAERLLGGAISDGLASLLAEKTGGNPFFTEQMLLDLRERGVLTLAGQGWALAGGVLPDEMPVNIQAVLLARLDRLAGEVKAVVQTAAVLGREFEVRVLSGMLRGDEGLPEKVKRAENGTIWSAMSELRYIFRHVLLRDSAYEMQLRSRLRELHALAVISLQQVYAADLSPYFADLAYHCDRAEDASQAINWYQRAAESAADLYANEDAQKYCTRALELAGLLGETRSLNHQRFDLLVLRETIFARVGNRSGQWADLDAMDALACEDEQRCKVLQRQISRCRVLSARQEEKSLIAALKQLAQTLGDPAWLAEAYYTEGLYYTLVDEKALAQASLNRALAWREQIGDVAGQMDCCCALAIIYLKLWQYADAMQWIEKAQALSAQARPEQLAFVLRSAASAGLVHKDHPMCYRFATQLLELATKIGEHKRKASAHFLRGQALCAMFRIDEGFKELNWCLQIEQDLQNTHSTSIVLGEMAYQYMTLGDFALAREYFRRSMVIDQETHYPHGYCTSLLNLSFIALCEDDAVAAKDLYQQGLVMARELGNTYLEAIAIGNLGEAEQLLGEYDASLPHTYRAIELLEKLDQPAEVSIMQIDLAITYLKLGNLNLAQQFAEKLIAAFPRANADLNDAQRLLWAAARVFHAAGQTERAAAILSDAYQLYGDKLRLIPEPRIQAAFRQMKFNRQIAAAFEENTWPE